MKHFIAKTIFGLTVVMFCPTAYGQPPKSPEDKREQIESLKISFITQKLDLTRDEAQSFWPVYNEYYDALQSLRNERREELRSYSERFEQLSDKEMTDMVDKQIIYRQRELDVRKKYHAEFKSVLPVKKVALLYRAEDEFKAKVLGEFKARN